MGSAQNGMQSVKYNHGQRKKESYFSNRKEKIKKGKRVRFSYENIEHAKRYSMLTKERKALMFRKGKTQVFIFLAGVITISYLCYFLLN